MYVLGLGGSNHDFSACIIENGKLVSMIEDERITRKKHAKDLGVSLSQGFSRKYCLNETGLDISEIDLIVANDIINPAILFRLNDVQMINHHLAHAASVFFCSPYEEAAILVVDSVGSKELDGGNFFYESITYAHGKNNHIEILQKNTGKNVESTDYIENSPGIFFSLITEIIGFEELQEGKTMGLAPYGTDDMYKELRKYIEYGENGNVILTEESIRKILSYKTQISSIADVEERFSLMANFAWAAQQILEEVMICLCQHLYQLTGSKNLCIAGGVALNSAANYKIYKKKIFDNIFVQPAAGDNGTSIGAALYGYYVIMNNKRII
jgi:nodulation protein nolNO